MRVLFISKKQSVPVELGPEWKNLREWWPDWCSCMGSHLAGKVLVDADNNVALIGVVKFKKSEDRISQDIGLKFLRDSGYIPVVTK